MSVKVLTDFLERSGVRYVKITHSKAYTAQEIAQSAHVAGSELAKTVIVKKDGKMAMVVLPATCRVDLERLKELTGAKKVELAAEAEFKGMFPECEIGAMPPFGNLYGMEVFVALQPDKDDEICFNAGTHTELIRLAYKDYERVVGPKKADCCEKI